MLHQTENRRRLLRTSIAFAMTLSLVGLIPWRMVAAQTPGTQTSIGPRNLNFVAGLAGWSMAGQSDSIKATVDSSSKTPGGQASLLIDASASAGRPPYSDEDGRYLHQEFDATPFIGKTIRFRASVKSALALMSAAGIALRVDGTNYQKAWNRFAFTRRPQPMDWTKMEYVLTVPPNAARIDLMLGLLGKGKMWTGDMVFEVVSTGEKATPMAADYDSDADEERTLATEPRNLDFHDGLSGWGSSANGIDGPANPYYVVGVDPSQQRTGKPSGFLMATVNQPKGYGALRQDIAATAYRGKRIRFSGYFRPIGVVDMTTPLLSIDGDSSEHTWVLKEKSLRGNSDWQHLEFVADVPNDANTILFGASIHGRGKVLVNSLSLEVVGKEVPLSPVPTETKPATSYLPKTPVNIDFTQGLEGWSKADPEGDAPDFAIGLEKTGGHNGGPAAFLTATKAPAKSYGTLLSYFIPEQYRGKRLHYSAYLRTENVEAAGLWLRVDRQKFGAGGGGWNMVSHPIQGTTAWKKYECVLDIPADAAGINFGIDLKGKGKVWVDGFAFEIVGKEVPVTPDAL